MLKGDDCLLLLYIASYCHIFIRYIEVMGCNTIITYLDCYRKPFLFAQPPEILRTFTQVPRSWILFLEIFRLSPGLYCPQTWPSVSTATASRHDSTTQQHSTQDRDQCSTASQLSMITATQHHSHTRSHPQDV